MQLTTLSTKALLVKLTTRRANLTTRDQDAEQFVQQALDDGSLTVNRKLFRDPSNPINKIVTLAGGVYQYHKTYTMPWIDRGPRLLPTGQYVEYTRAMRERIQEVESALNNHMPHYDAYVQQDISHRSKNPSDKRAKLEDYPTADEFRERVGFDLRFMPLPERKHFLFDISDEDAAAFDRAQEQATIIARNDAVSRMLKPLQHLASKLEKPIGEDGSIFRDSALENIIEGVEVAKKLLVDDTDGSGVLIQELEGIVAQYGDKVHWLRESPVNREAAAKKMSEVADKMSAFMKGV